MARVKQTLRAAEPAKKKADAEGVEALKRTRAKKAESAEAPKTREKSAESPKKTRAKKAESAETQEAPKKTRAKGAETPKTREKSAEGAKAKPAKKPGPGGIVVKRRWHPGTVAKRESRRLRKTMGTTLVLQRGPFRDLVRASLGEGVAPVTADAYRAIQSIVEARALFVLDVARMLLESGKRSTLCAADIDRAIELGRSAQTFLNEY